MENGNSVDENLTIEQVIEFAKQIQRTAANFDDLFKGAARLRDGDDDSGASTVNSGLRYAELLREVLGNLIKFLESPLGRQAGSLVFKYADGILAFVEIGAGALIASSFLVVGQELLDLKEDNFRHARASIESSIRFVKRILPSIEERLEKAVELLPRIQQEVDETKQTALMMEFKHNIHLAKLDIEDCETKLDITSKAIEKALVKITARIVLNGVVRGAILSVGALAIYHVIRKKLVNLRTGLAIGTMGLVVWTVTLRKPYYRTLERDFKNYKHNQEKLHHELARLKRRLQHHETYYKEGVLASSSSRGRLAGSEQPADLANRPA